MPTSTADLLLDLLEEQEDALRAIKVHLSVGEDLSPSQLDGLRALQQRMEETRAFMERLIDGTANPDALAKAG